MRIVIWGAGKSLEKNIHRICLEDICCLIDSDTEKQECRIFGKKVYGPEKLSEIKYDYVVISSELYFDEIAYQLLFWYGVEYGKILGWKGFLQEERSTDNALRNSAKEICINYGIRNVLDVGGILEINSYWNIADKKFTLDILYTNTQIYDFVEHRYRKAYADMDSLSEEYDFLITEKDAVAKGWTQILQRSHHAIAASEKSHNNLPKEAWVDRIQVFNIQGLHLLGASRKKKDVCIYQVTHKKFSPVNGKPYKPIHAGRLGKVDLGYQGDEEGDNISALNDKINECTALYWIWKNDASEYVGLNHYRRLFRSAVNKEWMLQDFEVQVLLEHYDIIVAEAYDTGRLSVLEVMRYQVCGEALDNTYETLCDIIQENKEDYRAFQYVMNGHMLYPCNMFIASKEIMDAYCEWLFPILLEAVEKVEIKESWDDYSKRILGFFAERLLTVWIVQHDYRIKELPILFLNQPDK
ncbi:DUF4422 domain-containing protein [Acetatifactor aquisgranensis]|uniref:DUF4422 domain-containing protein n=1 Tax=Acetatifactor aquisgranensis TaxID=2941233 RepID=UPI00203AF603|nr:DUF4422 domain-containing protein [Acetatifactor aquisgranensis]